VLPAGNATARSFTSTQAVPNTPTCLPRNSPTAMPSGTRESRVLASTPANDRPEFANANSGNTP